MNFEATSKQTILLNPRDNMARQSIPSEIRKDPLTGRTSRICHFMKLSWPKPDFDKLTQGTAEICPFCPDKVMTVTPCFPGELVEEGRMVSGDKIIFPNIAPYDGLSAVAVMSGRHFVPVSDLKPDFVGSNFAFCLDFFRRVHATAHPESVYHIINWNYMPPAGSSLIHAHLQVFATSNAPNLLRQELEASKAYYREHGVAFWSELVRTEESRGERFLGRFGRSAWLTPFAPMGVAGDVMGVVEGVNSTLDLTDKDIADLAEGLCRAIAAYDEMGIYSFNMNFFTSVQGDGSFLFHLLFSPRTFFNQSLGTPDVGALRNLYNESLCMAFPEEIASRLRPYFS